MQGHGPNPLNDRGVAQVARLADRLAGERVDRIVSSDLLRTAMTAAIVAARIAAPIRYDAAFRERDPGDHTGLPYEEAGGFFDDPVYAPPNGETQAVFETRVRAAFDGLAECHGATDAHLAVVTHGMVCAAFYNLYLCGDGTITGPGWMNASLTVADFNDGLWTPVLIGDAAHLETLGPAPGHPTGG